MSKGVKREHFEQIIRDHGASVDEMKQAAERLGYTFEQFQRAVTHARRTKRAEYSRDKKRWVLLRTDPVEPEGLVE